MNLNLLVSFIRVVERGSLSAAAQDLFLTQPAVSKHLQTLEEIYGVQLIERVGGSVSLTETGEIVYQYAREIIGLKEEMEDSLNLVTTEVRGRLVIGASTVPGNYILPALIGRYKKEYPEVKVFLEIGDTERAVNSLLERRLDLAVVGAPVKNRKLVSTLFEKDRIVLIVPINHPFASRPAVSIDEVLGEKLIWREKGSGTRKVLEEKLIQHGVNLKCLNLVLEMGSTEAILTAVEEGLGISLISNWAVKKSEASGKIKSVEVEGLDLERNFYVVFHKQKNHSRAAQAFLDMIVAQPG